MPEISEEKFTNRIEAETRQLVSDLEMIKEQLKIIPDQAAKVELDLSIGNLIEQLKW